MQQIPVPTASQAPTAARESAWTLVYTKLVRGTAGGGP